MNSPASELVVQRVQLGTALIDYRQAWESQRHLHTEVAAGLRPPTVLLLEHAAVYTAGKRTEPQDRPTDGSEVIEVDRGGRITWHGPGQLVCYPIVTLPQPFDVVAHVRRLEQVVIDTCADWGIASERIAGRSGVWCAPSRPLSPPAKIAAVGVRVARGVTMHGLALNVDCDLSWADRIVPCGLADAGVTSMAQQLADRSLPGPSIAEVADRLERHLRAIFDTDESRTPPRLSP